MFITESYVDYKGYLGKLTKYLVVPESYIAGGCFKNIFNKEKFKDLDIFFESEDTYKRAKEYYKTLIKVKSDRWKFVYENENCYSILDKYNNVRLELVSRYFGKPEEMIARFDFSIVKFALYLDKYANEYYVVYDSNFFKHLHLHRLVVDMNIPLEFPAGTYNRMIKYLKYGYEPCHMTKKKLLFELSKLDFSSVEDVTTGNDMYAGFD